MLYEAMSECNNIIIKLYWIIQLRFFFFRSSDLHVSVISIYNFSFIPIVKLW